MVDRSHQPAISYMEVVTDRSTHTLYPIIRAALNPNINVIVHTDRWATYNILANEFNTIHRTVNHSDPRHRFIYPDGVHTQGIESHWNRWKLFIKYINGIRKERLPGYLNEFMFRERNRANIFKSFLIIIKINN